MTSLGKGAMYLKWIKLRILAAHDSVTLQRSERTASAETALNLDPNLELYNALIRALKNKSSGRFILFQANNENFILKLTCSLQTCTV